MDKGQAGSGEQVLAAIRARSLMRGIDSAVVEVAARHGTDGFTGEDMARIDRHNLLAMHASLSAEKEALQAQLEREKAGWAEAFRLGVHHQDRAEKLSAENATLREQRDAMAKALQEARTHSYHAGDCYSRVPMNPPRGFHQHPCDCGRDHAKSLIDAALSPDRKGP